MDTDRETFLLLGAYRDGELSPGEALAMERRLAADPALRDLGARMGLLSAAVKDVLGAPPVPGMVRARLVQAIGFQDELPRRGRSRGWQAIAAMLLVGVVSGGVAGVGGEYWLAGRGASLTRDAVMAGHLRGLLAPQPFDIASSNRHVVKPWFNGRTTIAPTAVDLADQGFPLAGGRIDVVDGWAVPTLVYRRDRHVISVTVVPGGKVADGTEERRGYRIRHWREGDLTYWLVSDLDAGAFHMFDRLFRQGSRAAR